MKKIIMVAGLAMSLVLASAVSAFAATNLNTSTKSYDPTPAGTTIQDGKYPAQAAGTNTPNFYGNNAANNVPNGAPSKSDAGTANEAISPDVGPANASVTRIHSNYAHNTNACASCHATHTGVGEDLLQWDGDTETCMACHDGTAGVATYNVSAGEIGATTAITNGGLFPTSDSSANSKSMHDVFGGVQVSAAPGGNFAPTGNTAADKGNFGTDFSCVSCHSPHGNGGNFRILDPNVNGFASLHTQKTPNLIAWNIVPAPSGASNAYVVKAQYNDYNSTAPFYAYLLTGPYPYGITVTSGDPTYSAKTGKVSNGISASLFSVDNSNGYTVVTIDPSVTNPEIQGNVGLQVKGNVKNYLTANEQVTYTNGIDDFCGACHTDYNTSIYSTTSVTDGYGNRTFTKQTAGAWTQAANGSNTLWQDPAHTLPVYIPSHVVSVQSGTFTQAYRHTVGLSAGADGHGNAANGIPFDTRQYYQTDSTGKLVVDTNNKPVMYTGYYLTCLSCHVAHGTDNNYWQAYSTQRGDFGIPVAAGGTALTADAQEYYQGSEVFDTTNATGAVNGNGVTTNARGSNLKRMPNMGVCEGCHEKGLNDQGYMANQNAAN